MCKFYSAIIMPDGSLIHDIHTTSHEDLIQLYGLNDDKPGRFAKVEYTSDNLFDLSTYQLNIDDVIRPEWLTDSMFEDAERKLHQIVKKRIITEDRKLLIGGIFIVAENVKIDTVKNAVIEVIKNSTVNEMRGNSHVGTMWGNSHVGTMRGNSRVGTMLENSHVGTMRENSQVGTMWGNSHVGTMLENSRVGTMLENSQVGAMRENSHVGTMWGNSHVGTMRGNSRVGTMLENSQVGAMRGTQQ